MTWTKLSDDYTDQCAQLSDAAFRTHTEGLVWVMRRETGGYLSRRDVLRLAESKHAEMAVTELVSVGWWTIENDGYRIVHHMEHQPEPDLIERRRELTAERVRKHRRKKAGLPPTHDVTHARNALPNALPGSGRVGTGKTPATADLRDEDIAHDRDAWRDNAEPGVA